MSVGPVALVLALLAGGSPAQGVTPEPPTTSSEARTAGTGAPSSDLFAEAVHLADAAFAHRDDANRLDEAIARYRTASAARPGEAGVLVALARAEAFRAMSRPSDAKTAWREASRAAERALRAVLPGVGEAIDHGEPPSRVAARVERSGAAPLYWFALSTMGMAQARGVAAVLAVKDDVIAMMRRAAELDDRLDFGGPHRALGAWLATIPSAAGGGASAARAQFERARALFPDYQLTNVQDAGVLAVLLQDRMRFDALLAEVVASDDSRFPDVAPENRLAKRMARELLARRETLF